jgi:hypothetical protein
MVSEADTHHVRNQNLKRNDPSDPSTASAYRAMLSSEKKASEFPYRWALIDTVFAK